MVNSDIARKKYDADARIYHRMMHWFSYASTLKKLIAQIPMIVPQDGMILDMGCGTGIGTEVLVKRFPGASTVGLDQSESMLHICHERLPNVGLILGDFNQKEKYKTFPAKKPIALAPNSYDIIFTTGAVSEYADLSKTIPLIFDMLKPGGQYVNIGIKKHLVGKIMGALWKFKPAGREKLMSVCKQAGFTVTQMRVSWKLFPTSYVKYVVIANKAVPA